MNEVQSHPKRWQIDLLCDTHFQGWQYVLQEVTDAMNNHNTVVNAVRANLIKRTNWLDNLLYVCFGKPCGELPAIPNVKYTKESDFIYAIKNGKIEHIDSEYLIKTYYKSQDLRRVDKVIAACKLGNGTCLCDVPTLRSVNRVCKNIETYREEKAYE